MQVYHNVLNQYKECVLVYKYFNTRIAPKLVILFRTIDGQFWNLQNIKFGKS